MATNSKPDIETAELKPAAQKTTCQQQLAKLLTRKLGATTAQVQAAFGWQPHTARAAISTLRKAGAVIERSTSDKGAVYRLGHKA